MASAHTTRFLGQRLSGLLDVEGGGQALPCVWMLYGSPSSYILGKIRVVWHTRSGRVKAEKQGDALMPLLFSMGQHRALEAIQSELHDEEFLSRIWMTFTQWCLLRELVQCTHRCSNICGHTLEFECTAARRRSGTRRPNVCDVLERIGDTDLFEAQQGMKVLGTPLGHPSHVEAYLQKKVRDQQTFLERIPAVQDLQSAWSLLVHCASARANYLLRVVTANYARSHDDGMWSCFCRMMRIDNNQEEDIRSAAGMPLILGGLGLRNAVRLSRSAFWAS